MVGEHDANCPKRLSKAHSCLELIELSDVNRRLTRERLGLQIMARKMLLIDPKGVGFAMGEGQYERAGGEVECQDCRRLYLEHPEITGYPTFHVLCSGEIVKT